MPSAGTPIIGINEVGHVVDPTGTPVDTPWGNTQQDGVTLQMAPQTVELISGQAKMREDVTLVSADIQIRITLVHPNLQAIQRAAGLPDTAFTGDLAGGVPSAEVLTVTEGNLGTQERALYAEGPGPGSTRRIDVARARVANIGDIAMASNAYTVYESTWSALNVSDPADLREPLLITDAV